MRKMIYQFPEGDPLNKELLGGKGAGLAKMVSMGLPVPKGFTITTEQCVSFYQYGKKWPIGLKEELAEQMQLLEKETGKGFGSLKNPLLVSIRSGARASMPGMMDTILNVGLNDKTVLSLAALTKNHAFAWDCYRRLIVMFSTVVFNIPKKEFDEVIRLEKQKEGVASDNQLSVEGLKNVVYGYKCLLQLHCLSFPQDVHEQLHLAVTAVFLSWNNKSAVEYRMMYPEIKENWGTAVTVQEMVFGNMGDTSGSGVAFSRDPATGENTLYAEWLLNAQGEDAVDGSHTPQQASASTASNGLSLEELLPHIYDELLMYRTILETEYQDMVDMEFTIENNKLYMLQVRVGKRTGAAAIRIAVEMAQERLLTEEEAIMRITENNLEQMLHSVLKPGKYEPLTAGLNASPGSAVGRVVFTADDAVTWTLQGHVVVLVRSTTSPEDLHGMKAAQGILTANGGRTSHAAVVGRQMGKPCVVGCSDIAVDEDRKQIHCGAKTINEGDWISIDGGTGLVFEGQIEQVAPVMTSEFKTFIEMCRSVAGMEVWANAETPEHALVARNFGAQGIGLARNEHMFFGPDRLAIMQNMILHVENDAQRRRYMSELGSFLFEDFKQLFEVFKGLPVTVRLLDPPLHEFIPNDKKLEEMGYDAETLASLKTMRAALHEHNPMMGFRGCRLAVKYPDLYEEPVRKIIEAAIAVPGSQPAIMIPLVSKVEEFIAIKALVVRIAAEVMYEAGVTVHYTVGVMIETPAAALLAREIAEHAGFFSFGTNDLTQLTLGFSRDDSAKFITEYLKQEILQDDPFVSIDTKTVGELVKFAVNQGREANPNLKIGICGEHGGDPKSIEFFNSAELNYVSCAPPRIPIALHAAAQATIKQLAPIEEV